MATLFFPPTQYVPRLPQGESASLLEWCRRAGIPCKASGEWIQRQVTARVGNEWNIQAEPGPMGAVLLTLPAKKRMSDQYVAREVLNAMAYALFDGVARESVKGQAWWRQLAAAGRPKSGRAKSTTERQRAWRARTQSS